MSSRSLEKVEIPWQNLAVIDSELTAMYVDSDQLHSHKISVGEIQERKQDSNTKTVTKYLQKQYQLAQKSVTYQKVSYLPESVFTPIGAFSRELFLEKSTVPSLNGFLAEILPSDVLPEHSDFSVIRSQRLKKSWMLLGLLSFVNASCEANIEYMRTGSVLSNRVFRKIEPGSEFLAFYDRHFFGDFNVECMCPHKEKHGEPFLDLLPKTRRRRSKKLWEHQVQSTPKRKRNKTNREDFPQRDPTHRYRRILPHSSTGSSSSDISKHEVLQYDSVFSSFDIRSISSIATCGQVVTSDGSFVEPENNSSNSYCEKSPNCPDSSHSSAKHSAETLQCLENCPNGNIPKNISSDESVSETYFSLPLFDGHDSTTQLFFHDCQQFFLENNLSQKC